MTVEELVVLLQKYKVPFGSWGSGTAKTFDHFLKELNVGESKLVEKADNLFRQVRLVVLDVYYLESDKTYKLTEDYQLYQNGRVVRRNLKNSVLEKLLPDENPHDGVKRALAEELGITDEVKVIDNGKVMEVIVGKSYPGLMNEGTLYQYEVYLSKEQFHQDGYTEIQEDKTSYFTWIEL